MNTIYKCDVGSMWKKRIRAFVCNCQSLFWFISQSKSQKLFFPPFFLVCFLFVVFSLFVCGGSSGGVNFFVALGFSVYVKLNHISSLATYFTLLLVWFSFLYSLMVKSFCKENYLRGILSIIMFLI